MNAPYEHSSPHPENLIYKNISGNTLRSKSEMMIDLCLYMHKIPYRYECPLQLGTATLYPDFTLRHPETGKYFYWEHFGLMDNPKYIDTTFSKLRLYACQGIIPGIQLITTYETKENPLNTEVIEKIIEHYFL